MTQQAHTANPARPSAKVVVATVIGNFTEWFDFTVYGALAVTLGTLFFPSDDPAVSLLASLSVFGIAFLFRPAGGAILGAIGDKHGRKTALMIAVVAISVATTLIGLLPTYASIGVWAPILLILMRITQGLSAGGEWTSASAFLAEYAPSHRRATWVSLVSVSAALAIVSGSLVVLLLETSLGADAMKSWGWRIPFLVAAPLGLVGLYMRLRLEETPVYRQMKKADTVAAAPIRQAFVGQKANMLLAFFCASVMGVGLYYLATYFLNALSVSAEMSRTQILGITALALVFYAAVCPFAGLVSDSIGRRPVFIGGCLGHAVLAIPVVKLVTSGDWRLALVGLLLFGLPQAALNVVGSITVVELFPASTRSTGAAVAYGLGIGPVAGSAPLVATALVDKTDNPLAAAYYLMAIALITAATFIARLPETLKRSLYAHTAQSAEPHSRGDEAVIKG